MGREGGAGRFTLKFTVNFKDIPAWQRTLVSKKTFLGSK
jgi:hypothetical protein